MKRWLILAGFVVAGATGIASIAHAAVKCEIVTVEYECSCGGPPCEATHLACQSGPF